MSTEILARARRVIDLEIAELLRLHARLDSSFDRAVAAILACVEKRGKIVVCGVGKSGNIGEKIAATLTSTGCPAVVLNSTNALHGDLGMVTDGDLLLALSQSGETDELINILPSLARFDVQVICMTGNPRSSLAQASHVVLDTSVEQEACPLNLAPTSSTTVMLVLGDALAMVLLEARGFTKADFARFHPGGRLGRTLLLKVHQIMRPVDQLAIVAPAMLVRQVLQEINTRRAGAAVTVDAEGKLAGIFTHGDFVRHFQATPGIGELPIEKFVTHNPICVSADKLAMEVLHILEKHRIDDLVVVDGEHRPVGIIDSQDIARLRLA
jgi:arabinose-5-phosphate isomerase